MRLQDDDMEWIAIAVVVFAALMIRYVWGQKRRYQLQTERLLSQWGQVPEREYISGDLQRISRYFEKFGRGDPVILDDITWKDLDMDDMFMLLNHTQSSVGEEALYRLLRTPQTEFAVLQERARLAEVFDRQESLRLELERQLSGIGKQYPLALCDYISHLSEQSPRSNMIHYGGLAALALSVGLILWTPAKGIPLLVAVIAFQIITYFQQKAKSEHYFSCIAKVERLAYCGQKISELPGAESIAAYQERLRQCLGELEPIRRRSGMIAMGKAMGGSPLDMAADYIKMLLHVDLIAYNQIVSLVKAREAVIWQVVEVLGELECGLAIGSFRRCLGQWCEPCLKKTSEELFVRGEQLYHPLVDRAVPNSVSAGRCQLITGSNASGKSTYLKTVAVNAVLAQTIYTAAGSRYEAPFYQIYSSMALTDDLIGGESYYMVEIRSLKRILDRGRDPLPVLCFVDEVLRGTNTVERIAASAQILKSMAEMNLLCFAASHDGELTWLLEEFYENSHFSETITDGDVLFTYRIRPGRATGRNALKLLGLMGYEEQVLKEARDMAARFDRTGVWSMNHES